MATKPKAPPGEALSKRIAEKLLATTKRSPGGHIVHGLKPAKATRVRMAPDVRKGQLDAIVLEIFRTKNYMSLTRRAVAEVAEVSESLPTNYYGTAAGMRKEALRMACAACTPADVKAVQRALETGDIKRADVSKKMLQALK